MRHARRTTCVNRPAYVRSRNHPFRTTSPLVAATVSCLRSTTVLLFRPASGVSEDGGKNNAECLHSGHKQSALLSACG
jgi:hypothetical protein